ncbi:MAG TPA: YjhX family toxin [Rhizomicrobium sp.]|nr:YjhX family toxin [Rhizomicrobium sp.]
MNISKVEQRALHVLAQGGHIRHQRDEAGHIVEVICFTRDGYGLADCTLAIFRKLKSKRLIESRNGGPYHISRRGRLAVRPQADNR